MNLDKQIHHVALFYFYSLLDRGRARVATVQTVKRIRKINTKKIVPEELVAATIVSETQKGLAWAEKLHPSRLPAGMTAEHWKVPRRLDLGAWRQFQKDSDRQEFLALIWSQILGFSDEQIADGLGVTEGTVRHRVGRALRGLSISINPGRYDE